MPHSCTKILSYLISGHLLSVLQQALYEVLISLNDVLFNRFIKLLLLRPVLGSYMADRSQNNKNNHGNFSAANIKTYRNVHV
jgi:hypothetical protein